MWCNRLLACALLCAFATAGSLVCLATAAPATGQPALGAVEQGQGQQVNSTSCCEDCQQIISLLKQQKGLIFRQMGQVKREIAVLKESLSEAGVAEIFAGIGYILGVMGLAYYFSSRKFGKNL